MSLGKAVNGVGKACFVLLAWNSLRVDWWSQLRGCERYGHFIYLAIAGLVEEWVLAPSIKLATVYIRRGGRQSSVVVSI